MMLWFVHLIRTEYVQPITYDSAYRILMHMAILFVRVQQYNRNFVSQSHIWDANNEAAVHIFAFHTLTFGIFVYNYPYLIIII